MIILIDIQDNIDNTVMVEIASLLRVIQEQKPLKSEDLNMKELRADYKIIKREGGAIDYTLKVLKKDAIK